MHKVHRCNRICMRAKFLRTKIQENHHIPLIINIMTSSRRCATWITWQVTAIYETPQHLSERFVNFFTDKIEKTLNLPCIHHSPAHLPCYSSPTFSPFFTVTENQVAKIITNFPNKSCSLDQVFVSLIIWTSS